MLRPLIVFYTILKAKGSAQYLCLFMKNVEVFESVKMAPIQHNENCPPGTYYLITFWLWVDDGSNLATVLTVSAKATIKMPIWTQKLIAMIKVK